MRITKPLLAMWLTAGLTSASQAAEAPVACGPLLDHEVRKLGSEERVNLCEEYRGSVVLVVTRAASSKSRWDREQGPG